MACFASLQHSSSLQYGRFEANTTVLLMRRLLQVALAGLAVLAGLGLAGRAALAVSHCSSSTLHQHAATACSLVVHSSAELHETLPGQPRQPAPLPPFCPVISCCAGNKPPFGGSGGSSGQGGSGGSGGTGEQRPISSLADALLFLFLFCFASVIVACTAWCTHELVLVRTYSVPRCVIKHLP